MPFHYIIEIAIGEPKANTILKNPNIIELAKKNNTTLEYNNGILRLICAENQDIDEELVKKILLILKGPVKAKAYLIDGKSKVEIFNGKLDPKNPFGQSKEVITERTIDSMDEDENIILMDDDLVDFLSYNENDDDDY
ncbi:MAG: hypothetical protein H0Z24_00610 [Thermosipho sp. (in: Bacteria)]|nr:hypothetical protein [Thermosipho sp. (in: thermotogales)]